MGTASRGSQASAGDQGFRSYRSGKLGQIKRWVAGQFSSDFANMFLWAPLAGVLFMLACIGVGRAVTYLYPAPTSARIEAQWERENPAWCAAYYGSCTMDPRLVDREHK